MTLCVTADYLSIIDNVPAGYLSIIGLPEYRNKESENRQSLYDRFRAKEPTDW